MSMGILIKAESSALLEAEPTHCLAYCDLKLPVELWGSVFINIKRSEDLANTALICRSLRQEAESVLYRCASVEGDERILKFFNTMLQNDKKAHSVRSLSIFLSRCPVGVGISINTGLRLLGNLKALEVWGSLRGDGLALLLQGCTFRLRSLRCPCVMFSSALLGVLQSQTSLNDLELDSTTHVHYFALSSRQFADVCKPPGLLPHIRVLNAHPVFFSMFDGPRHITHLCIPALADASSVDQVVECCGPQLVSLQLHRTFEWLVAREYPIMRFDLMPRLQFIRVVDLADRLSHKAGPYEEIEFERLCIGKCSVKTFVWEPVWLQLRAASGDKEVEKCHTDISKFAQSLFMAWPSLKTFIYKEDTFKSFSKSPEGLVEREGPVLRPDAWRHI